MKTSRPTFLGFAATLLLACPAFAGTISYVAIPSINSDAKSGISAENTYTSAVDGGNASGTDREIGGVSLYSLVIADNEASENDVTISPVTGTITNAGNTAGNVQADGKIAEVFSDMTANEGADDDSTQEIVLDPSSLTAGQTYDLRIYIANYRGQNRLVNLSFACDSQPPVETGFFNEDDATTSAGAFPGQNQAYYINYRYTWDGTTTPGVVVTQKFGKTPFLLYALTNQEVEGAPEGASASGGVGLTTDYSPEEGWSEETDVGVDSEDFYQSDSLNDNGEWVEVGEYGRCWRPTKVARDWAPYRNGRWTNCGECGMTFVSEEQWSWATYHYGRWAREEEVGWCWVPGRVWAPSWVSWREGDECGCVGWAPLPPKAVCRWDVGISTWIDETCDIGPDYYNFVKIVDFSSPNIGNVIINNQQNINIINQTVNVTNIVNNKTVVYNGGPNIAKMNLALKNAGKNQIQQVHINKVSAADLGGGKHSKLDGNTLTLAAPHVKKAKDPSKFPKLAKNLKNPKLDTGWQGVKDPKVKAQLKKQIAQENKGHNPKNKKAQGPMGLAAQGAGGQAGGKAGKQKLKVGQPVQAAAGGAGQQAGKGNGQMGQAGQKAHKKQGKNAALNAGAGGQGAGKGKQGAGAGQGLGKAQGAGPGQLKKQKGKPGEALQAAGAGAQGAGQAAAQGGKGKQGKGAGKLKQAADDTTAPDGQPNVLGKQGAKNAGAGPGPGKKKQGPGAKLQTADDTTPGADQPGVAGPKAKGKGKGAQGAGQGNGVAAGQGLGAGQGADGGQGAGKKKKQQPGAGQPGLSAEEQQQKQLLKQQQQQAQQQKKAAAAQAQAAGGGQGAGDAPPAGGGQGGGAGKKKKGQGAGGGGGQNGPSAAQQLQKQQAQQQKAAQQQQQQQAAHQQQKAAQQQQQAAHQQQKAAQQQQQAVHQQQKAAQQQQLQAAQQQKAANQQQRAAQQQQLLQQQRAAQAQAQGQGKKKKKAMAGQSPSP